MKVALGSKEASCKMSYLLVWQTFYNIMKSQTKLIKLNVIKPQNAHQPHSNTCSVKHFVYEEDGACSNSDVTLKVQCVQFS